MRNKCQRTVKKANIMKWIPWTLIFVQTFIETLVFLSATNTSFQNGSVGNKTLSVIWLITYFYTFICYLAAASMSPGYLNISWISQVQNDPNYVEEPAENGEKNFCSSCMIPRPSRCHHCKECGKCVLLMDHHCTYVSNCIGFRNYKAFFLFLVIFPIHGVITIAHILMNFTFSPLSIISIMLSGTYFIVFGILVLMQLYYQIPFLLKNITWIENTILHQQRVLYEKAKRAQVSPYDVGVFENIKVRFGPNPFLWLIPTPNNGNPYYFKKNMEYVPIYKLNFSFIDDFINDKQSLMSKYRPKVRTAQSLAAQNSVINV